MGETTKPQVVRGQSSWGALWVSVLVAVASVSVFIVADQWLSIGHNADTIRLPTVDISPLFDNRATSHQLHRVAQQLLQAASNTGCLFVIGHGFNHTQQTATLAAAHELMHGVSPSTRRSLAVQPGKLVRGYVSLGGESGAADLVEVKEGFSYGYEWPMHKPPMSVLQGPNVWPTPEDGLSAASRKHVSITTATWS
jgi:isopenicillin N synthase-like dioxygenase